MRSLPTRSLVFSCRLSFLSSFDARSMLSKVSAPLFQNDKCIKAMQAEAHCLCCLTRRKDMFLTGESHSQHLTGVWFADSNISERLRSRVAAHHRVGHPIRRQSLSGPWIAAA